MVAGAGTGSPRTTAADRAGQGHLQVGLVAGQSTVLSAWAVNPFKLLIPRARGAGVWAYASSYGGGLVAGDQLDLRVTLGAGSCCFLGTQASTKVYRNPDARPCGHRLEARVDAGSLLVVAPDPVSCFAGAYYRQNQSFALAAGAGLVLVDWLTSGRAARGERWAFARFESRNEVRVGHETVFLDALRLDPQDGALAGAFRGGRFNCLALVAVLGHSLRDEAAALLRQFERARLGPRQPVVVSVSPVPHGVLLRLAGERVEDVAGVIARSLAFVRHHLRDDPWARKY